MNIKLTHSLFSTHIQHATPAFPSSSAQIIYDDIAITNTRAQPFPSHYSCTYYIFFFLHPKTCTRSRTKTYWNMQILVVIAGSYSDKIHERQTKLKPHLFCDNDPTPLSPLLSLCLCICAWLCVLVAIAGRTECRLWHLLGCCSTASAEYLRWGPSGSNNTHTQSSGSPRRRTDNRMKHTWYLTELVVCSGFLRFCVHACFKFVLCFFSPLFTQSQKKGRVTTGILSAHAVLRRSWGVICFVCSL